jgi:hypothetical protein
VSSGVAIIISQRGTLADTAVPDADFQADSAVFSEKELADLTIAIGLMNATTGWPSDLGFRRRHHSLSNKISCNRPFTNRSSEDNESHDQRKRDRTIGPSWR